MIGRQTVECVSADAAPFMSAGPGSAIQLPAAYCKTNTEIDRWAVLSFTLRTQGQETVK